MQWVTEGRAGRCQGNLPCRRKEVGVTTVQGRAGDSCIEYRSCSGRGLRGGGASGAGREGGARVGGEKKAEDPLRLRSALGSGPGDRWWGRCSTVGDAGPGAIAERRGTVVRYGSRGRRRHGEMQGSPLKRVREVVSVEVDGCRRGGRCAADIENMTPDGWRDLTLAEVATVAGGGTPSRSERAYWNGDIPWATPTDVTGLSGRAISETRSMITEAGLASSSATLLAQDSLLMTTRATIGACAINRVPMATNQGFQNLVPKRSTGVDFLYYLIQHHKRRLTRLAAGSTFLELSKRTVRGFRVTVPPLSEQRKIAAILSSVDDAIEKTRAVIDQVQVVKRGLMQELLTRGLPGRHTRFKQTEIGEIPDSWDVVSLVGCGAKVTSGSRGWAKYYSSDGALFLRITNLARDTIHVKLGDIRRVALPPCTAESARTRVQAGDLLISITADLGMVGVVPDGIGEAYAALSRCTSQELARLRLRPTSM